MHANFSNITKNMWFKEVYEKICEVFRPVAMNTLTFMVHSMRDYWLETASLMISAMAVDRGASISNTYYDC